MSKAIKKRFSIVLQLLLIMFIVQVVNDVTSGALRYYGIHPRDLGSLPLIFTAPFIHGSWLHLFNNAVGMATFSLLVMMRGSAFYIKTSLFIIIVSGLVVWALGRSSTHIGASGWIFGLWSLTIATAWYERSFLNIVIALLVIVVYGGMAFGMLPTNPNISYESHIAGALAGVLAAAFFAQKAKKSK